MKTETYDPEFELPRDKLAENAVALGIRLTAVTNAADALLRVVDGLLCDIPQQLADATDDNDDNKYLRRRCQNLRIAIGAARGINDDKLPKELFTYTADSAVMRVGQDLGLIEK